MEEDVCGKGCERILFWRTYGTKKIPFVLPDSFWIKNMIKKCMPE